MTRGEVDHSVFYQYIAFNLCFYLVVQVDVIVITGNGLDSITNLK